MKYFTPELLKRFNSRDDEVADAAHADFERAVTAYKEQLDKIDEKLPDNVRRLLSEFYLQDAKVMLFLVRDDEFSIFLRPEGQRDESLMIRYLVTGKPRFNKNWLTGMPPHLYWLYDEIGIRQKRRTTVFTHSILFTGNRELQLEFSDLELDAYQAAETHGLDALLTAKSPRWSWVGSYTGLTESRHDISPSSSPSRTKTAT